MANYNRTLILHGYGDAKPEISWGHDLDRLRSCDVIGHVTIELAIFGFLQVIHWNHPSIAHVRHPTHIENAVIAILGS